MTQQITQASIYNYIWRILLFKCLKNTLFSIYKINVRTGDYELLVLASLREFQRETNFSGKSGKSWGPVEKTISHANFLPPH